MRKLPETVDEAKFLEGIKTVKKSRVKLALMLGFYQCLRVSEVAKLKPEDVDRGRGFLHILQAKGAKDRDVPIMKPVWKGLRHLPIGKHIRTLERWSQKHFGIKFHALRHSGATYYLNEKKVDIRHLQQLLGHSNLSTTQIYTHVTPENLRGAFEEVWK